MRAIVTDGITIGYWRCSASDAQLKTLNPPEKGPCPTPLHKFSDRYCPAHSRNFYNMCPVQPCTSKCIPGEATCERDDHRSAWTKHATPSYLGRAGILQRANSKRPVDPSVHLDTVTGDFVNLTELQLSAQDDRIHQQARDGGEKIAATKMIPSRCRTHNLQIIVTPCGYIVALETCLRAESVSSVKVRISLHGTVGNLHELIFNILESCSFSDNLPYM